jgi:hypothetical protein
MDTAEKRWRLSVILIDEHAVIWDVHNGAVADRAPRT